MPAECTDCSDRGRGRLRRVSGEGTGGAGIFGGEPVGGFVPALRALQLLPRS